VQYNTIRKSSTGFGFSDAPRERRADQMRRFGGRSVRSAPLI
jgi:hypothetical protein